MNKEERELFDYVMNPQGMKVGILAAKIHAVKQSGMREAAELVNIYDGRLPDEIVLAQWYVKACNDSRQAILTAAEKPL